MKIAISNDIRNKGDTAGMLFFFFPIFLFPSLIIQLFIIIIIIIFIHLFFLVCSLLFFKKVDVTGGTKPRPKMWTPILGDHHVDDHNEPGTPGTSPPVTSIHFFSLIYQHYHHYHRHYHHCHYQLLI